MSGDAAIRVAVVFGGQSGEHDVSCASAASILTHLDRRRYRVSTVKIAKDGCWTLSTPDSTDFPRRVNGGQVCSICDTLEYLRGVDVVFPALHGPYGEDGTIQSVLELAGIPYVGNGVLASAIGMDKEYTKKLLAAAGLPVADGVVLRASQQTLSVAEKDRLGLPVFVKPARAGSSLGVSRVDSWDQLDSAISNAKCSDPKVIVEQASPGREIDIGVLEMPNGTLQVSPSLEIKTPETRQFFDYDAKYHDSTTIFQIPAQTDPNTHTRLEDLARRAFDALDCSGLLRVDCFVDAEGITLVNEVNTFPGFTATSQYPRMWYAAGLQYPQLLDTLIKTALSRARTGSQICRFPSRSTAAADRDARRGRTPRGSRRGRG
jgi:D-alanine-D-alanine ligase